MSRKKSVGKNNYSGREDNRNRNKRKKVRRPSDKERGRYEYRSNDVHSRERRKVRDREFAYEDRYERDRRERAVRNRYNDFESRQRIRETQQGGQSNRFIDPPPKSSGALLFSFIWTLFFYSFTIGLLMMAIMFSFSSKSSASIFGYRFYTVLTNSMAPQKEGPSGGFYAGDIVIMKMVDGNQVKENDIVTFPVGEDGTRYLTHRVVDKRDELNGEKGNYLVTKGDANESKDPPIKAERVIGKVIFAVPKMGSVLEFIREEFWASLVFILSLYGFFLVLKSYFFPAKEVFNNQPRKYAQNRY